MPDETFRVKVWDPFVRISHGVLAVAFLAAYAIEDEWMTVHAWLGYVAGLIVVLRVLWGLVGPRPARFSDFLYPPRIVFGYLADPALFRARRYLGHSPAGGAMAVALLLGVTASVLSGLAAYAYQGKGPLRLTLGRRRKSRRRPCLFPPLMPMTTKESAERAKSRKAAPPRRGRKSTKRSPR